MVLVRGIKRYRHFKAFKLFLCFRSDVTPVGRKADARANRKQKRTEC